MRRACIKTRCRYNVSVTGCCSTNRILEGAKARDSTSHNSPKYSAVQSHSHIKFSDRDFRPVARGIGTLVTTLWPCCPTGPRSGLPLTVVSMSRADEDWRCKVRACAFLKTTQRGVLAMAPFRDSHRSGSLEDSTQNSTYTYAAQPKHWDCGIVDELSCPQ